jgi:hypothetical protein
MIEENATAQLDPYGDQLSGRTMSLAEAVRSALEKTLAGIEEPSPKARRVCAEGCARENVEGVEMTKPVVASHWTCPQFLPRFTSEIADWVTP